MEETKTTAQVLIENLPLILTALSTLIGVIFGGVMAILNFRRTGRVETKTDEVNLKADHAIEEIHATNESSRSNSVKIDELHSTVNGKSEELLQATQELAFVKGAITVSPAIPNEILDEAKAAALTADDKKGE